MTTLWTFITILAYEDLEYKADPCFFVFIEREIWLLVYVDDLAIAVLYINQLDSFYSKPSAYIKTKNQKKVGNIFIV
jgi:hypothetical protein